MDPTLRSSSAQSASDVRLGAASIPLTQHSPSTSPELISISKRGQSEEFCSWLRDPTAIYTALCLPSSPDDDQGSEPHEEFVRVRIEDFEQQLLAFLPELSHEIMMGRSRTEALRAGLGELKNGKDGFKAVRRRNMA